MHTDTDHERLCSSAQTVFFCIWYTYGCYGKQYQVTLNLLLIYRTVLCCSL